MAWNGSGVFSRLLGWVADKNAGIDITASRMDTDTNDIVTGLNNVLCKDGQNFPTTNLPMAGNRHTNVGNGVARNDYAAMGQIQDSAPQWGGTSTGTANAQVIAPSPVVVTLAAGQTFRWIAGNNNTAAATLEVNGTASSPLIRPDGSPVIANDIIAGYVYITTYDGGSHRLAALYTPVRGFLSGLTLSNDGVAPNTVLDIAAGQCADSTNAVSILLAAALTKSTGGAWTVGTGGNGMGNGLTVANTTWYHVFAIINGTARDVYFDTSPSGANVPTGTTFFRRIGSFLTDGSAHIVAFVQNADTFSWTGGPVADLFASNPGTSAVTRTLSVPTGVRVTALMQVGSIAAAGSTDGGAVYISDLLTADVSAALTTATINSSNGGAGSNSVAAPASVLTNTSGQVRSRLQISTSGSILRINTLGWVDTRGRLA